MKIAYVITRSDSIGGAHRHVVDLATEMQRRGHAVQVFAGGNGPFCQMLADHQIAHSRVAHLVREIAPWQDTRAWLELRRLLAAFGPDLVHAHSSKAGILGRLASRSLGTPCIFTAHGWAFTEGIPKRRQRLYKLAERLMAPLAHTIITVSNYDRSLALAHKVGSERKLVTVLNGVRDASCTHVPPAPGSPTPGSPAPGSPAPASPVRLIMVARFDEQKDHSTLIRALAALPIAHWKMELIGDGPLKEAAVQQAQEAGIEHKVLFLGSRNDVPARLAASDVFVLSTHWEGLPLSILEAMSAGLPIVATDVGGVSETLVDGRSGYLAARNDVAGLAEKLSALITDSTLRAEMGKQARARYKEKFTLQRMVDETEAVYERAVGGRML